jgi:hypothetical protein
MNWPSKSPLSLVVRRCVCGDYEVCHICRLDGNEGSKDQKEHKSTEINKEQMWMGIGELDSTEILYVDGFRMVAERLRILSAFGQSRTGNAGRCVPTYGSESGEEEPLDSESELKHASGSQWRSETGCREAGTRGEDVSRRDTKCDTMHPERPGSSHVE